MFSHFVGIDIGKTSFSVAILDRKGILKHEFSAKMDKQGFEKLLSTLNSFTMNQEEMLIGMESSGSYQFNLFYFLTLRGFTVILINPVIVKQFTKLSLRKCKTDKKDATSIAKVLILEREKINNICIPAGLREIVSERENLCYQVAKTKTEIKRLIHMLFPEIEGECSLFSKSVLTLLQKYPSACRIANAKPQTTQKFLRGRFRMSSNEILELAKNSIGVQSDALELVLVTKICMLMVAQEALEKITQSLVNTAKVFVPLELELLTSIKGIDVISASHFMSEIGGHENFRRNKGIIAYAGIDPTVYESGKYKGKSRISKRGNRHLRRILWIMAVNVVMSNPYFRTYFMKKRRDGKPYKMAMMCVVHKLIRVIYAMLVNRTHFRSPELL